MAIAIEKLQSFGSAFQGQGQPAVKGIAQYLSEENFVYMKEIMHWKKLKKGDHLFWEGEKADKLYYIRSGQVKMVTSTEDGKDMIFSIMQQGDLIAEMNGGQEEFHTYSAKTMSNTEVGVIFKKDLEALFAKFRDLSLEFMYWLGLTHRITQSKLRDLLLYGKTGALASTLIRLSNTYGVREADGSIRITLKVTNTDLGEMIGATRESVNRMLSDWKDARTLDIVEGKFVIYSVEKLRRFCSCSKAGSCPVEICRL